MNYPIQTQESQKPGGCVFDFAYFLTLFEIPSNAPYRLFSVYNNSYSVLTLNRLRKFKFRIFPDSQSTPIFRSTYFSRKKYFFLFFFLVPLDFFLYRDISITVKLLQVYVFLLSFRIKYSLACQTCAREHLIQCYIASA